MALLTLGFENPSIINALVASSMSALLSAWKMTPALAPSPFTILSLSSSIILWALLSPIPLMDLILLMFSEMIASRNSSAVIAERIILAEAAPIPEIPKMLTDSYMFEKFGRRLQTGKQIIGLGYDSVAPVVMDLKKTNILALIGPENTGKSNFIKYWIHSMERNCEELEVFIFISLPDWTAKTQHIASSRIIAKKLS